MSKRKHGCSCRYVWEIDWNSYECFSQLKSGRHTGYSKPEHAKRTAFNIDFTSIFRIGSSDERLICETEFEFSDAEQLVQCEWLAGCPLGLPQWHQLRERKQSLGPDEQFIRLTAAGLSFVNGL